MFNLLLQDAFKCLLYRLLCLLRYLLSGVTPAVTSEVLLVTALELVRLEYLQICLIVYFIIHIHICDGLNLLVYMSILVGVLMILINWDIGVLTRIRTCIKEGE